ncbi:MAG: SpoIID/LytB domain-containing protein [Paludibacteraceae bacterium]|nr:SpoIID/LytB domain-containing protein [Paludibacteraceae bacterium]
MNISVGIYSRSEIPVEFYGDFRGSDGHIYNGSYKITEPCVFEPITSDARFELKDVTIGINFHWQRNENQCFKGSLSVVRDGGLLAAINVLDIEDYLCSVISSEMSAASMVELLKAHAIISRSWAMRKILERKKSGKSTATDVSQDSDGRHIAWYGAEPHTLFDVCADDHCQRYQGFTRALQPQVIEAVNATKGMVLAYNGEICDCRFHKCCGGMTERYDVCWENVEVPYLQPVKDEYCGRATSRVLEQVLNDYDFETKGYYRWSVEYSQEELSTIVKNRSSIDFGIVQDLVPLHRGYSGRIDELKIVGTKRTLTIGKELEIRKWLSNSHLYSSAFEIERTSEGGFRLVGKGWGHGVGLCQIGAAVMASEGKNYKEILNFYYTDTQIININ